MTGRVAFWVIYGSLFIACGSEISENRSSSEVETDALNEDVTQKVGSSANSQASNEQTVTKMESQEQLSSASDSSMAKTQTASANSLQDEPSSNNGSETTQTASTASANSNFDEAKAISTLEDAGIDEDSLNAAVVEARAFNQATNGGKSGDQEVANLVGILDGAGVENIVELLTDLLGVDLADFDLEAIIGDIVGNLPVDIF